MLSNIFTGIFDTTGETVIAVPQFILCIDCIAYDRSIYNMGIYI